MGGYSSTLFHLLYRFSPDIRTEFGRSDEHRWVQRYGFEEHTVGKPDDDSVEDGRNSRRRKFRKTVRERPGLVPSALFHIIGNTVFLKLADVASGLPDYTEQILLSSMDSEEDATGYSQRSAYGSRSCARSWRRRSRLAPSGCWRPTFRPSWPTPRAAPRGRRSSTPGAVTSSCRCRPCRERSSTPRRRPWWTWWRRSAWRGAGVLVYATHTGTRDITERMDDILTRHGFRVAVMKADAVAPERREAWVEERVKQGIDVMICHPRLVQTGLDLIDFPTLCWFETEFSVFQSTQKSTVLMGGRFGCS